MTAFASIGVSVPDLIVTSLPIDISRTVDHAGWIRLVMQDT